MIKIGNIDFSYGNVPCLEKLSLNIEEGKIYGFLGENGVRKTISKKMFPGYVLVHMIKNDVTWYVVRNTRGVTGFVGPGSEPVPLSDEEMRMFGVKKDDFKIDVAVGDKVRLISGAFEGTEGVIKKINGKQTVVVEARMLGERLVDVEIGLDCIKKL